MSVILVTGIFDNLRTCDIRFLQEASRYGPVRAVLWRDDAVAGRAGHNPRFPQEERLYLIRSLRWVAEAALGEPDDSEVPAEEYLSHVTAWARPSSEDSPAWRKVCERRSIHPISLPESVLDGFPSVPPLPDSRQRTVVVTGCYDWLHSGHVRFFEEASAFGRLYVGVGRDASIRALKGPRHPMLSEDERRYAVASVRYVHEAFICSGVGWLDAAPDMERIRPDYYVVNEDGHRPEKQEFCRVRGIEYLVLRRLPREGLPPRSSTELRGF